MALDPTTDYITREERYLAVMAGAEIQYPEPITREERFLAAMCDPDNNTAPDPITRREHYLSAIIENIGSGGMGELIATDEVTVNTTATTAASVKTVNLPSSIALAGNILYVRIRDKAGLREGYFYGSDNYYGSSGTPARVIYKCTNSVGVMAGTTTYGVYLNSASVVDGYASAVNIYSKYNSSYGTINGTYAIEVYVIPIS